MCRLGSFLDQLALMPQFAAGEYSYMIQIATELVMKPRYSYSAEFEFGLDLILDSLERLRAEA
jgi:hypothetical protein